jgi:hypothetical protein
MNTPSSNHLTTQLEDLEKQGYTDQLKFENGALLNLSNKKHYSKDQISISREFRFEGMTNPSDMSILFAVDFNDGRKGTLAAPYGSQGDADLFEFMNQVSSS